VSQFSGTRRQTGNQPRINHFSTRDFDGYQACDQKLNEEDVSPSFSLPTLIYINLVHPDVLP